MEKLEIRTARESLARYPGLPKECFCPECRFPWQGDALILERNAAVGLDPAFARWCQCEAIKQADLEERALVAEIPEGKLFAGFKPRKGHPTVAKAAEMARAWATGEGLPILVLLGITGTGKSHLAAAAAHLALDAGGRVLYREHGPLIERLHQAIGGSGDVGEVVGQLSYIPWLVLDDLGVSSMGPWDAGKLDEIIQARWRYAGRLRTLVTTNIAGAEMAKTMPRIHSRLSDTEKALHPTIDATDYRRS